MANATQDLPLSVSTFFRLYLWLKISEDKVSKCENKLIGIIKFEEHIGKWLKNVTELQRSEDNVKKSNVFVIVS